MSTQPDPNVRQPSVATSTQMNQQRLIILLVLDIANTNHFEWAAMFIFNYVILNYKYMLTVILLGLLIGSIGLIYKRKKPNYLDYRIYTREIQDMYGNTRRSDYCIKTRVTFLGISWWRPFLVDYENGVWFDISIYWTRDKHYLVRLYKAQTCNEIVSYTPGVDYIDEYEDERNTSLKLYRP